VLLCISAMAPLGALVGFVSSLWLAIALMGLVAFVSQCWTTTTSALATDVVPRPSVGVTVGMMGTAGGLGGAAFAQITGRTVQHFGFTPAFVLAAVLMPAAVLMLVMLLRSNPATSGLLRPHMAKG
jgi:sugar phosphate permease